MDEFAVKTHLQWKEFMSLERRNMWKNQQLLVYLKHICSTYYGTENPQDKVITYISCF